VRARFILAAVVLAGAGRVADAATLRIEFGPPASEVAFRAYGLGLLPIDASFTRFDGWLVYDPDDVAACQVELRVEVTSLVTADPAVRNTMVGPDLMDAAAFPTLSYVGTCDGRGLGGTLTMHGIARAFTLSLSWSPSGVVAEGRLLREEWGMTGLPLFAGRTVRIRVAVPLPGTARSSAR
jgi:polyisoprenoid-binding protein YceI